MMYWRMVTIRPVQVISREGQTENVWNPQRPYAGHPERRMMIWSRLHGDMQGRRARVVRSTTTLSKIPSEIPCRVSSDLHEWCNDLSAVSTRDSAKLWCS